MNSFEKLTHVAGIALYGHAWYMSSVNGDAMRFTEVGQHTAQRLAEVAQSIDSSGDISEEDINRVGEIIYDDMWSAPQGVSDVPGFKEDVREMIQRMRNAQEGLSCPSISKKEVTS